MTESVKRVRDEGGRREEYWDGIATGPVSGMSYLEFVGTAAEAKWVARVRVELPSGKRKWGQSTRKYKKSVLDGGWGEEDRTW